MSIDGDALVPRHLRPPGGEQAEVLEAMTPRGLLASFPSPAAAPALWDAFPAALSWQGPPRVRTRPHHYFPLFREQEPGPDRPGQPSQRSET
ncbi:hypothetical protein SAMN05421811_103413 [Nonomuraea wenchangensis]|uniref:Uncharacterized protein n=1 Tax=Nonomuraea wenchangensis TaxID=568860 RepID=A0A1I0FE97_9ACTN|nr:hypothetical protein SAMN05421811_103413 [Nonomuraea wenchangensis]